MKCNSCGKEMKEFSIEDTVGGVLHLVNLKKATVDDELQHYCIDCKYREFISQCLMTKLKGLNICDECEKSIALYERGKKQNVYKM